MTKIFCVMGKSSSGKDSIYTKLMEDDSLKLQKIVPYTTRPIRNGELEGREYHFTDEIGFKKLNDAGKIIEQRVYQTVHGPWRYFTVDDGSIVSDGKYIVIGTLEVFISLCKYFGKEMIIPIYVEVEDGIRLERALNRERQQKEPKYEELCRRFLADCGDFSEEKILEAGIEKRFENNVFEDCLTEIKEYIKAN